MNEIRIIIAEDHKTVRKGLKFLIEAQKDMRVIGEANDGREAIQMTQELRPDVLLMDISMPELNGLKATAKIKRIQHETKILTLTRHTDEAYLHELLQAGVSGYVLKQSDSDELIRAIRAVASGGKYLDPAIIGKVFNSFNNKRAVLRGAIESTPLSEREAEILRKIAWGYSSREIAEQFDISVKTVEAHKANCLKKLKIKTRLDIVHYAVLQGWLQET
jgi:DNA-binding NarL/FixJ family response regulator